MIAAQHHGGLVLGAYDGRRMVGVLFGITGVDKGRPYHYSHITGVAKEYQSKGVGFKLKLAQREHVIKRGEELVLWTYDPLQAGNAYRERIVHRLGPVSLKETLFEGAEPVNQTRKTNSRLRIPLSARLDLRSEKLLVEIPSSIVKIRDMSVRAANAWTLHCRQIFENYFQKGYMVTDVTIDNAEGRVFYLLESRMEGQ